MAITALTAIQSTPTLVFWCSSSRLTSRREKKRGRVLGTSGHLFGVLKNDVEFLKKGINRGIQWANDALQVPKIVKKVDDVIWLRNLEDPNAPPFQPLSWPQPYYPALSGVDLFVADLKAVKAYANYFYSMTKIWSRPLPDYYDPEEVANYFNCRPHVVALRLLEVFSAFSSALIKIRLSRVKLLKSWEDEGANDNISQYEFGVVLKETMLNLGPTFIKVGQSLSTRPDIIGFELSKALSELHDQIPPFPRTLAMKIIEEDLGSTVEKNFSYVSEEPIAAASFGQVYRGTTFDGCAVAIKVQRPNLHHVVVRDIYILRLGLGLLQKLANRRSDPRLYADELGKGLMGELDYRLEAENASEFLEAHSPYPFIHVPKVFQHLTRRRVLTMEWVVGERPKDLLMVSTGASFDHLPGQSEKKMLDAKRQLLDMVNKGVEASLVQLLETGLLHADPHPGNLRYTTFGQIGFLDFGLMCRMERKHQLAMLASIIYIVNGDWASLVRALSEMDVVRPGTNMHRIAVELENDLGEVEFKDGIPDVKFSRVLGKIWSLAFKYHFRMPPYYTLVLRSLASLEGLAVSADENFKTFEAAYPYVVRKLLTDNSDSSKRILYSVVLNRRKEFQWKKLALFLRVGAARKGLINRIALSDDPLSQPSPNVVSGTFDAAYFVLRLLPSKDGAVLRRLLMVADGSSLTRALLSKEAISVRQQLCQVIADVLYQRMALALGKIVVIAPYNSLLFAPSFDYHSMLRDRRLKVIFKKILHDTWQDPKLMLKFCWESVVLLVTGSFMACHRLIASLSESLVNRMSFAPMEVAASS
ncbi:hypothetical protein Nepgr_013114 [Nepenthes gracilis]|uniref:Protein kinase domain-containing protein n=1 Tax=Nepenthes gracilis TaxID=150966 RepID=A0AAD3SH77_NEPGR|nr:hypothetical protein Nepgr_013114 [Nepenthes gracilis]